MEAQGVLGAYERALQKKKAAVQTLQKKKEVVHMENAMPHTFKPASLPRRRSSAEDGVDDFGALGRDVPMQRSESGELEAYWEGGIGPQLPDYIPHVATDAPAAPANPTVFLRYSAEAEEVMASGPVTALPLPPPPPPVIRSRSVRQRGDGGGGGGGGHEAGPGSRPGSRGDGADGAGGGRAGGGSRPGTSRGSSSQRSRGSGGAGGASFRVGTPPAEAAGGLANWAEVEAGWGGSGPPGRPPGSTSQRRLQPSGSQGGRPGSSAAQARPGSSAAARSRPLSRAASSASGGGGGGGGGGDGGAGGAWGGSGGGSGGGLLRAVSAGALPRTASASRGAAASDDMEGFDDSEHDGSPVLGPLDWTGHWPPALPHESELEGRGHTRGRSTAGSGPRMPLAPARGHTAERELDRWRGASAGLAARYLQGELRRMVHAARTPSEPRHSRHSEMPAAGTLPTGRTGLRCVTPDSVHGGPLPPPPPPPARPRRVPTQLHPNASTPALAPPKRRPRLRIVNPRPPRPPRFRARPALRPPSISPPASPSRRASPPDERPAPDLSAAAALLLARPARSVSAPVLPPPPPRPEPASPPPGGPYMRPHTPSFAAVRQPRPQTGAPSLVRSAQPAAIEAAVPLRPYSMSPLAQLQRAPPAPTLSLPSRLFSLSR